jgi:hypothetical protein
LPIVLSPALATLFRGATSATCPLLSYMRRELYPRGAETGVPTNDEPVQEFFFSFGDVCAPDTTSKPHGSDTGRCQLRFLNPAKNRSGGGIAWYQQREVELIIARGSSLLYSEKYNRSPMGARQRNRGTTEGGFASRRRRVRALGSSR